MKFARILLTLLTLVITAFAVVAAVGLWGNAPLTPMIVLVNVLGSLLVAIALTGIWTMMIFAWREPAQEER